MKDKSKSVQHPLQPLYKDEDGKLRFKVNAIVRYLYDASKDDMNALYTMPFDDEDREQFAQLVGYTLCGAYELPYFSNDRADEAEEIYNGNPPKEEEPEVKENEVHVKLTVFEWHLLMSDLEHFLQVVNRDTENTKIILEKIASQLNNGKINYPERKK